MARRRAPATPRAAGRGASAGVDAMSPVRVRSGATPPTSPRLPHGPHDAAHPPSGPSPSSTPASAGSPSCTSCSCSSRTRTSSTSATPPASRTASAPSRSSSASRSRSPRCSSRDRAKLLVVACNTATAAALPALQRRMMETTLGVDVIGVVRPEAVQAVAATRNGRIGLLATPATVRSGAYEQAVHARRPARRARRASRAPTSRRSSRAASRSTSDVVDTVRGVLRAAAGGAASTP